MQDPYPLQIWTGSATLENTLAFEFAKKYMLCLQKNTCCVFNFKKNLLDLYLILTKATTDNVNTRQKFKVGDIWPE
jgi:hypothetical protein